MYTGILFDCTLSMSLLYYRLYRINSDNVLDVLLLVLHRLLDVRLLILEAIDFVIWTGIHSLRGMRRVSNCISKEHFQKGSIKSTFSFACKIIHVLLMLCNFSSGKLKRMFVRQFKTLMRNTSKKLLFYGWICTF